VALRADLEACAPNGPGGGRLGLGPGAKTVVAEGQALRGKRRSLRAGGRAERRRAGRGARGTDGRAGRSRERRGATRRDRNATTRSGNETRRHGTGTRPGPTWPRFGATRRARSPRWCASGTKRAATLTRRAKSSSACATTLPGRTARSRSSGALEAVTRGRDGPGLVERRTGFGNAGVFEATLRERDHARGAGGRAARYRGRTRPRGRDPRARRRCGSPRGAPSRTPGSGRGVDRGPGGAKSLREDLQAARDERDSARRTRKPSRRRGGDRGPHSHARGEPRDGAVPSRGRSARVARGARRGEAAVTRTERADILRRSRAAGSRRGHE
jgi:hypothetical protein